MTGSTIETIAVVGGTVVATLTLTFTMARVLAGGSWKLSGRITSIEGNVLSVQSTMISMQREITRIGDVLERIADLRGDIRVLETRLSNAEQDIRELQHGEGMVLPLKSAFEKP